MILLIDNYDSFVFNLLQYFGDLGTECCVVRNDALSVSEALAKASEAIVISPGPGIPAQAGICVELIRAAAGVLPVLGVCLGHQAIGEAFGGTVSRAPVPMHGKTSMIAHNGTGIFAGIESPFEATRYHSLIVAREGLPAVLDVTATSEDGLIMGLSHRQFPIFGVQFHPESIISQHGHEILRNFLDLTRTRGTPSRIAA